MKKKSVINKFSLTPLYIGITGHRDIRDQDREPLKNLICEFIAGKKLRYPHTPLVLLTPLAEGADRIAAIAAIECKIEYIAVLPMPVDLYRMDFADVKSIIEFNELLANASFQIDLPLQKGVNNENINSLESRNEQYYQNGLFISRQCHNLIALWDGTDNGKKGGTADVVRLKNSGIPGKADNKTKRLTHLQTGPIYHIITPRKSEIVPDNALSTKTYYPSYFGNETEIAEKNDDYMLKQIDSYNKDITKYGSVLKEKIEVSSDGLFSKYPEFENDIGLKNIALRHGVSGELSTFFQKRRFLSLRILFSLVVVAFLFLQIYAEFYHKPIMLLLYPITMGIGAIWFLIAKKKHYELKHEDYRALSEAYRIQFYMNACNLKENVSDHYLKRHRGKLEWVIYILRSSHLFDFKNDEYMVLDKNNQMKAFSFLKENWIDTQLDYFKKSAKKNSHLAKKWEQIANRTFIGAILSACLLFLLSSLPDNLFYFQEGVNSFITCTTHFFLVLSAAFHGYSEKMIFSEQSKNYQQMAELFHIASNKIKQAIETKDKTEAYLIISELSHEALLENGDWFLLHRSRPLEIPKG